MIEEHDERETICDSVVSGATQRTRCHKDLPRKQSKKPDISILRSVNLTFRTRWWKAVVYRSECMAQMIGVSKIHFCNHFMPGRASFAIETQLFSRNRVYEFVPERSFIKCVIE